MGLLSKLVDWYNGGYTKSSTLTKLAKLEVICAGRYDSRLSKIEHSYLYLTTEYRSIRTGKLTLSTTKLLIYSMAFVKKGGVFSVVYNYGGVNLPLAIEMANGKVAEKLRYDDMFLKTLA